MDPREAFIGRVDLAKTRVRPFEGFVFLCGGQQESAPVPLRSVRHMLYHELVSGRHSDVAARLKLAEEIQDWFRDGTYQDLLTFEEHLAGLSAVIVLIAESPGAVAELGAFSMSDTFLERMLVLVASVHYEAESFIRLGPIQRVENSAENNVLVYDWHERDYAGRSVERYENLQPHLEEIVDAIKKFTSPSSSERVFKASDPSHIKFLICELCDIFGALNKTEIKRYLGELKLDPDMDTVSRYLFLLEKCDLLRIKASGHGRYYYAIDWRSRISFGFRPGEQINKDRVRVDVAAFYEKNLRSRHEVLRRLGG